MEDLRERRPCPACGESIVATALKCRFCGEMFDQASGRLLPGVQSKDKGEFASCPKCSSSRAERVRATWWGGVLGPWLLTHVKCLDCGTTFNGKTGRSNTGAILAYSAVILIIVVVLEIVFGR